VDAVGFSPESPGALDFFNYVKELRVGVLEVKTQFSRKMTSPIINPFICSPLV
jgi:hypothetical protein